MYTAGSSIRVTHTLGYTILVYYCCTYMMYVMHAAGVSQYLALYFYALLFSLEWWSWCHSRLMLCAARRDIHSSSKHYDSASATLSGRTPKRQAPSPNKTTATQGKNARAPKPKPPSAKQRICFAGEGGGRGAAKRRATAITIA